MKKTLIFIPAMVFWIACSGQSGLLDVMASSGDYYTGQGITMSLTFGETFTETLNGVNLTATQGFQQPISVPIRLDVTAFLQGPFVGDEMLPYLNFFGYLPLKNPYTGSPWNYPGQDSVLSVPNNDVVDWVLVQLRDTPYSPDSATSNTIIEEKAALLLREGRVVDLDGSSILQFRKGASHNLHVVLYHRNHLGIMSALPLTKQQGVYTYDFTDAATKTYGGPLGCRQIVSGTWGMIGGDGNADGVISMVDKIDIWAVQSGSSGYKSGDFNMNGNVNNEDKIEIWAPNAGSGGQVPDNTQAGGYSTQIPL